MALIAAFIQKILQPFASLAKAPTSSLDSPTPETRERNSENSARTSEYNSSVERSLADYETATAQTERFNAGVERQRSQSRVPVLEISPPVRQLR